MLVIEEGELAGWPRRVETFSFKSRDLSHLKGKALEAQMIADAKEALSKYGETLDIRRPFLQPLLDEGSKVPVSKVRLVYEGNVLILLCHKSLFSLGKRRAGRAVGAGRSRGESRRL